MTDISIIIVNYNVKHFLDQCLRSVRQATKDLSIETWVVDNDSIDGSVAHVQSHYAKVKLIANKENVGFAQANNQAIKKASGKYILLLNPDTIIENDTLTSCFDFMESKPDAGAVGVKMIDGEGRFLPESKRGFPSPWTSVMRLSGLSTLFPQSRLFNKYNLGYLKEDETNEVDVLCGAFMFIRAEALDKVGLFDESFFMYGEDIDLSYRIQQGGYKIYYHPESTIVHFKGESTKKSSLKYYSTFYHAMAIFAKKHYGGRKLNPFLWLINLAIILVGFSDYLMKSISRIFLPMIEFGIFLGILHLVEFLWARFFYQDVHYYDEFNSLPVYLIYSLLWLVGLWIAGSYRSVRNLRKLTGGIFGGTLIMLILYALLDDSMRHSRAILVLSAIGSWVMSILVRQIYLGLLRLRGKGRVEPKGRVVVAGNSRDVLRAREILDSGKGRKKELIGALYLGDKVPDSEDYLQSLARLPEVIEVYNIDEVLFSAQSIPMKEIMEWMTRLGARVNIKILSNDVQSIIGSHDRNSRGDLYTVELRYRINLAHNKIFKILVDYLFCFLFLIFSPLILLFSGKWMIFRSLIRVILRKRTWVSYIKDDESIHSLPELLPGITVPVDFKTLPTLSQEEKHSINFFYARDFSILGESGIILLNLGQIFRKEV